MILLSSVLPWHPASPRLPVRARMMCLYSLHRNRLAGNITRDTECIFHLTPASVASIFHHLPLPPPAALPFPEFLVFCPVISTCSGSAGRAIGGPRGSILALLVRRSFVLLHSTHLPGRSLDQTGCPLAGVILTNMCPQNFFFLWELVTF